MSLAPRKSSPRASSSESTQRVESVENQYICESPAEENGGGKQVQGKGMEGTSNSHTHTFFSGKENQMKIRELGRKRERASQAKGPKSLVL